ncbi:MAG: small subunit ribosomal protein S8 [Microgenomates group bacterium Gr01-1014_93]|nr:MAG: small subunit ribosomal protein S8 [Microgenomates group bacterium Gr01-1014_93]
MVTDPVADALIRIKNGYLSSKQEVLIPFSTLKFNLCKLLEAENYISSSEKQDERWIKVILKYNGKEPAITDVKRISKPGLRVYKGSKELPRVLNGLGIAIISTPKGLMTEKKARKEAVGGEIMAYVW